MSRHHKRQYWWYSIGEMKAVSFLSIPRCKFALVMLAMMVLPRALAVGSPVSFNHDIRPILAGSCLKCHGIDDGSRKSKLRLDVRETAISPAKSGAAAIVPGHPEKSEMVRRVFSTDPDVFMPPPSTHVVLTDAQK